LDGHGVGNNTWIDFLEATRSLPLILQRLFRSDNKPLEPSEHRLGPKCYLFGHGLGATYAFITASRQDSARYLQGVIALSPAVTPLTKLKKSIYLKYRLLSNFFHFYGFFNTLSYLLQNTQNFYPVSYKIGIQEKEQLSFFLEETFSKKQVLSNITIPVLWVHSVKDKNFDYEASTRHMMSISSSLFMYHHEKFSYEDLIFSKNLIELFTDFIKNLEGIEVLEAKA
jgi:hypothetical protein